MTSQLSVVDLNHLNLGTYIGRVQLRQSLETMGVPSGVAQWVQELTESQEAKIKSIERQLDAAQREE